jgi:hypothetical protein
MAAMWLGGASAAALAQGSTVDSAQGFWLQGTALVGKLETSFSSSSGFSDFTGTNLNLESDYGLASKRAVPSVAAGMHLGTRWRLEGELFGVDRSGSAVTLTRELIFDDYTYPVKTTVRANFKYTAFRFGGGYSFVQTEIGEVGVGIGLLGSTVKTRIELAGNSVGSGSLLPQVTRTDTSLIPMLSLYGRNSFGPEWGLAWRLDAGRDVGNSNSDITATNLSFSAHWRAATNLALHAGLRYFVVRADSRNDLQFPFASGSLYGRTKSKVSMSGPQVGVILSF